MTQHRSYTAEQRRAIADRLLARARLAVARADYVKQHSGPLVSYGRYHRMAIGYCDLAKLITTPFTVDWE